MYKDRTRKQHVIFEEYIIVSKKRQYIVYTQQRQVQELLSID